ncbi:hypothetical protein C8Q80DRAFT_1195230 [Daedaleopsis nitida]|nr:hypothetical protein C8Q80DRAFT_1195230 [Daedaleopsis nitida]
MSLQNRLYQDKATAHPLYHPISTNVPLSEMILPHHLRLSAHNWLEFKHAIETVLRIKGIPLAHLEYTTEPADNHERRTREQWVEDDELCKAIIVR